jgi:hypothetical protein
MIDLGFPSETIDLPSKGYYYPEDHPLYKSDGRIDIYLMNASHEDILLSPNLLKKGTVIDKLLEALIATKGVKFDDLLIGDKNCIFIASRILGYGKEYPCSIVCESCGEETDTVVDLTQIGFKNIALLENHKGKNEFDFKLPVSGKTVTFCLLTQGKESAINKELDIYETKVGGEISHVVTTRLRHALLAVDGEKDRKVVNQFVQTMPIRDSRALREYAKTITPDIDFEIPFECSKCGHTAKVETPLGPSFFWADA